jgi:hypothetical protein
MIADFLRRGLSVLHPWWGRHGATVRVILCWLAVLLPVILLARLIERHAVNIPFLDDWMFVQMDEKAAQGFVPTFAKDEVKLTFQDFFIVQMEHRMAFVRAIIMVCHWLFPANYVVMMWITWAMLLGTAVNVFLLLRRTTGAKFADFWPVMALATITLCTPLQWQIVLWAMMFQVAAPAFFLSLSLLVQLAPRPLWLRFAVGCICAWCATLSFASGILLWLLPLPLLFLPGVIREKKARWFYTGLWLLVFGVTMGLYFHDLKNETDPRFSYKQGEQETLGRDFKAFSRDPQKSAAFLLRLVGCHLSRGTSVATMDASLVIGSVSVLLWMAALCYWWRRFSDVDVRRALLPWLLFGAYSIGTAGLIALGRVWATRSGDNAITARYVIHAVPLTVSLIVLIWLIARDVSRNHPRSRRYALQMLAASAFVLFMLQANAWAHGIRMMGLWESSRLRGAANALFYNTIHSTEGDIAPNRSLARLADKLGLLDPPMLTDTRLDNFRLTPQLLRQTTAQFRALTIEKDLDEEEKDVMFGIARGFACLPGRERVADAVIFTRRDPESGHWEIFHVTQVSGLPLSDLETRARDFQFIHIPGVHMAEEGVAGFEGKFDLRQLIDPQNPTVTEHEVMAWAYDHREQRVFPMSGYFRINAANGRVKKLGSDPASVHLEKFLEAGKQKDKPRG